jgi:hypothetical protein
MGVHCGALIPNKGTEIHLHVICGIIVTNSATSVQQQTFILKNRIK